MASEVLLAEEAQNELNEVISQIQKGENDSLAALYCGRYISLLNIHLLYQLHSLKEAQIQRLCQELAIESISDLLMNQKSFQECQGMVMSTLTPHMASNEALFKTLLPVFITYGAKYIYGVVFSWISRKPSLFLEDERILLLLLRTSYQIHKLPNSTKLAFYNVHMVPAFTSLYLQLPGPFEQVVDMFIPVYQAAHNSYLGDGNSIQSGVGNFVYQISLRNPAIVTKWLKVFENDYEDFSKSSYTYAFLKNMANYNPMLVVPYLPNLVRCIQQNNETAKVLVPSIIATVVVNAKLGLFAARSIVNQLFELIPTYSATNMFILFHDILKIVEFKPYLLSHPDYAVYLAEMRKTTIQETLNRKIDDMLHLLAEDKEESIPVQLTLHSDILAKIDQSSTSSTTSSNESVSRIIIQMSPKVTLYDLQELIFDLMIINKSSGEVGATDVSLGHYDEDGDFITIKTKEDLLNFVETAYQSDEDDEEEEEDEEQEVEPRLPKKIELLVNVNSEVNAEISFSTSHGSAGSSSSSSPTYAKAPAFLSAAIHSSPSNTASTSLSAGSSAGAIETTTASAGHSINILPGSVPSMMSLLEEKTYLSYTHEYFPAQYLKQSSSGFVRMGLSKAAADMIVVKEWNLKPIALQPQDFELLVKLFQQYSNILSSQSHLIPPLGLHLTNFKATLYEPMLPVTVKATVDKFGKLPGVLLFKYISQAVQALIAIKEKKLPFNVNKMLHIRNMMLTAESVLSIDDTGIATIFKALQEHAGASNMTVESTTSLVSSCVAASTLDEKLATKRIAAIIDEVLDTKTTMPTVNEQLPSLMQMLLREESSLEDISKHPLLNQSFSF